MKTTLAALLGQDRLAEELIFQLDQTSHSWHLLSGPSGCGKSWVLDFVAEKWRKLNFPVAQLRGDRLQIERQYFPFLSSIAKHPSRLRLRRLARKGISEAGTLIPGAGSLATLVMDTVLNHKERKQISQGLFLSELEHEVLFNLQEIAAEQPLLIIADDIQYWDSSSRALLEYFADPALRNIFPFLKHIRILACLTPNAQSNFEVFGRELPFNDWSLNYFPASRLQEILAALGVSATLKSEDLSLIYSTCGGHLELIKRLAEYLSSADHASTANLKSLDLHNLMPTLLGERFKRFGLDGLHLLRLLELAAIVGTRFSQEEIHCLTLSTDASLLDLIPKAKALGLLHGEEDGYTFAHEIIQRYFQQRVDTHTPLLHEAFATCIARLRPADYLTRALHLQAAGRSNLANQLQFLAFLCSLRDGEAPLGALQDLCSSAESEAIAKFYRTLVEAYQHYFLMELEQARRLLERLEDILPPLLLAEKDYLFALCLKRSLSEDDIKFARRLLQSWADLKRSESDQWFRVISVLIVIYADAGEFVEAKLYERELVSYFSDRLRYDPFAGSGLNRLRRRCSALHSSEIALERCRSAADYFGPSLNSESPRNPLQWYLALTNLSGNLLMAGRFTEATDTARQALKAANEFRQVDRRPEIAINNLAIGALLSGEILPEEGISMLREAIKVSRGASEIALLVNNMAVAKIWAGQFAEALEDLEAVSKTNLGDYYRYFVQSNIVALRFLESGDSVWRNAWNEIIIPKIPEGDKVFLVRRQELQGKAFAKVKRGSYKEWDSYLQEHYPTELGPTWLFYGRGFLLSDMQFWFEF